MELAGRRYCTAALVGGSCYSKHIAAAGKVSVFLSVWLAGRLVDVCLA